jgi:cytochrome c oxidase accessory protein FixG
MANNVRLPILTEAGDGPDEPLRRGRVYPADVRGRYDRARRLVFVLLIAVWAVLPWIKVRGNPAVFLDIEERKFFLFGATFNAQDTWLLFFLLTGVGFGLVYATGLAGRVWCGWACPQTVFLDGVFRRIERLVEGPREKRMRRDAQPLGWDKAWRKTVVHALYFGASFVIAHIVLSYFVSLPQTFAMVRHSPADHPQAFAWAAGMTAAMYFDLAWFREQLCTTICPYGRLQGALVDDDSLVVGYDAKRGEPRGKATEAGRGDCVDCNRCVVVCPTGIDIRKGATQMECIGCTACIDACDAIMDRLQRPRGLIRYDSTRGLRGDKTRILRPRIYVYTVLLVAGAVAASIGLSKHTDYEANLLRARGEPYYLDGDAIKNAFEVHLTNKMASRETFRFSLEPTPDVTADIDTPVVAVDGLQGAHVLFSLRMPRARFAHDVRFRVKITRDGAKDGDVHELTGTFLGAGAPAR